MKTTRLLLLTLLISLTAPAHAETTASPTSTGTGTSAAASAGGPTLQVTEGTFTPAQMPANSDRAQKSKAAAAAAQAGSALQQVNCLKAQAEAQAEEDPDAKSWKQIAAGMQCQQAQQSQQSAKENEESAKALSAADVPKPASFTAGTVSITGGPSESQIEIPTVNTSSKSGSGEEEAEATAEESKGIASKEATGNSTPTQEQSATVEGELELPKSALNPIQSGSVVYDEKGSGSASGAGGAATGLTASNAGTGATNYKNDKNANTEQIAREIAQLERGIRAINGGGEEGGGGSDGDAPKSSGMLEALMAQLNPEMPQIGLAGGGDMREVASLDGNATKPASINIFEYATYRYQIASNTERVQTKRAAVKTKVAKAAATRTLADRSLKAPQRVPTDLLSASRQK